MLVRERGGQAFRGCRRYFCNAITYRRDNKISLRFISTYRIQIMRLNGVNTPISFSNVCLVMSSRGNPQLQATRAITAPPAGCCRGSNTASREWDMVFRLDAFPSQGSDDDKIEVSGQPASIMAGIRSGWHLRAHDAGAERRRNALHQKSLERYRCWAGERNFWRCLQ
jgi:hypothetical protein